MMVALNSSAGGYPQQFGLGNTTLGNGADSSTTDLSSYFRQFGVNPDVGAGSPCAQDASLWKVMLGSDGKCYTVCSSDPKMAIEIDSSYCSADQGTTLPSWALPVGAGVLLLVLLTR